MFSNTLFGLLAATLLNTASSHLIINSPVPYGKSTINNSPLVDAAIGSAGSDFPCKQRPGVYDITEMNHMAVGEQQTLSFIGSASHGGGTCQLAVTLDKEPTAKSVWRLIQVYQGGCPTTGDGNGNTNNYTYTIPKAVPSGQMSFSWSWYNKIGNREIYQNCAPITVTGGASDTSDFDRLPEWYIINLPASTQDGCESTDSKDVIIPNPGSVVITVATALASASGAQCAAAAASQTQGLAAGSGSAAATGSSADTANSTAVSASSPNTASGVVGGYATASLITMATPSAAAAPTPAPSIASSTAAAVPTSSAISYSTPSTGGSSSTNSTGSDSSGSGACGSASNGAMLCNGPSQFGLCNNGGVVWQPVAVGTACQNGQIVASGASPSGSGVKRRAMHNAHVRKHIRGSAWREAKFDPMLE